MPSVVVVAATTADLAAIDAIERHSFPPPARPYAPELTNAYARLDVAHRAGHVVGFANYWIVAHEMSVHAIATSPDARRGGVGRALLDHALAVARAAGCMLATLEVRRGNAPAIALYERAGFKVAHVRARYYKDDEDALVMLAALG